MWLSPAITVLSMGDSLVVGYFIPFYSIFPLITFSSSLLSKIYNYSILDFLDWAFFSSLTLFLVSIIFIFLFYIVQDIFIFQVSDRFIFILAIIFFINILFWKNFKKVKV